MSQAVYVAVVLTATIVLFASDRIRLDLAALLSLLALAVGGVLTPAEALAGFANPLTIMIAGLFVVGAGLLETGVADALGRSLGRFAGRDPLRLLIATMAISALLSAFLSSTGTVAVMLPVVLVLARRAQVAPSALLIPLAFGSLLGGMLTLIGTPPNIVVSNQLRDQGLEPFNFFAFTPVGIAMLVVGVLYMVLVGRHLLPRRAADASAKAPSLRDLGASYRLPERLHRVEVPVGSPLAGRTLADSTVRTRFGVTVLALESETDEGWTTRRAEPNSLIRGGDVLYLDADLESLERFLADTHTHLDDEPQLELPEPLMMIEAIVPPRSELAGRSLAELRLHDWSRATVLAAKRGDRLIETNLAMRPLQVGDSLLLAGGRSALQDLFGRPETLLVATAPQEWESFQRNRRHAPVAIAVLAGLLVVMGFGLLPNAIAVLVAAVAMVVGGCITMDRAYRDINWEAVVLIAAVLPMATALEKTGGIELAVDALVGGLGDAGPLLVMAGLFLITSLFSQVISNTATTVLIAPVAFGAATSLGVSPQAMLMAVAVAASTAFATPIASPVNALVLNPGGYRFTDFLKVGVPIVLLMLVTTLLVVPLVFPL